MRNGSNVKQGAMSMSNVNGSNVNEEELEELSLRNGEIEFVLAPS